MNAKTSLVFLAGKRTPFGSFGGSLKDESPSDLTQAAGLSALSQGQVNPSEVDHVIVGNVLYSSADTIYFPRHTGLKLGVPLSVPALGINRLCGSGFQVVVEAYLQMLAGDTKIALVAGVENMSLSPYALRGTRFGLKMGHSPVQDTMIDSLFDSHIQLPMGLTAENLAESHLFTREQVDAFALKSQQNYQKAAGAGVFKEEIVPYSVKDRKGNSVLLDKDEHPRGETTLEKLSQLKPSFKKGGVVTPGNASGIVDGAAALVVATESEAVRRGSKPLGRLVSYGIAGCDPKVMGIGPVPASQIALKKAGMNISQMDLIEVNEAFAPQTLAVAKDLEIPANILNVNGGAIAVGHPLAASGTRIVMTLLYELKRRGKKYGLATACIGGGQGIALVLEAY
jgi:acetyl-CoA acetyltransferase family protein